MKTEKKREKITIVGAGEVGRHCAARFVENGYDVVLIDTIENLALGTALDIEQSKPILGFEGKITGTNSYKKSANSKIAIIAAGIGRKPNMNRIDLFDVNRETVETSTKKIVKYSPNCITIVVVTNPVEEMTRVALEASGFDRSRVIGLSGVLDTARFKSFIGQELPAIHPKDINGGYVLGPHSEKMVPILSLPVIADVPLHDILPEKNIKRAVKKTKKAGGQIIELLGRSASFAPSAAVLKMVEAILGNKREVMPCAVLLNGEYGLSNVVLGVPVRLSEKGAEIVEIELSEEEVAGLKKAADSVKFSG